MRKILYLSLLLLFFTSCGWLNPSIMLKTGKDYQYSTSLDTTSSLDYRISPNDILDFRMYSNDGFKLIDLTSLNSENNGMRILNTVNYLVQSDGNVRLPIVGIQKLGGMTIREAQIYLEGAFADFYIRPYVIINITNKRVIVFPGQPGDAKVIPLENNNTTLIEALALAGGISENGKARVVKLIRQKNNTQNVYLMDLSTIQGLKDGSTVLQANDIIYVEPRRRYSSKFLQEIVPIVSLISTTFILYTYTTVLSKR